MNINHFFVAVALVLAGILVGYRPIVTEAPKQGEIAQLDLHAFTVYEMDRNGMTRSLNGAQGERFADRYEVRDIVYVDNREPVTREMSARFGRATEQGVTLEGDVVIRQNDGSVVHAQNISYDKTERRITSESPFTIEQGPNRASGERLDYRLDAGHISAENIRAVYRIPEKGSKK